MKKYILIIFVLLFINSYAQITKKEARKERRFKKKEKKKIRKRKKIAEWDKYVNPKNKWFFGAEIGSNTMVNYYTDKNKTNFQGGFLIEYYFERHLSISTKFKKIDTGVSFFQEADYSGSGGWFDLTSHPERYGTFRGSQIFIPFAFKWDWLKVANFRISVKIGISYNKETESNYSNYSDTSNFDEYKSEYSEFLFSFGVNYFLDNNSSIYLDVDFHGGTRKGELYGGLFSNNNIYTSNTLISIGYKYSFTK